MSGTTAAETGTGDGAPVGGPSRAGSPAPAGEPRLSARQAWTRFIVSTLATALLASTLSLCLWAALPAAFGWHPTTVSSGSMLPRLEVGDIAVSRPIPATKLHLGQVLLYDDPDHPGRLRMHRFIEVDENGGMITKGDANPSRDSTPISPDAVLGVGFLRVPYIGLPIVWMREGRWIAVGLTAAVLMGLAYLSTIGRGLEDELVEEGTGPTEAPAEPSDTGDTRTD